MNFTVWALKTIIKYRETQDKRRRDIPKDSAVKLVCVWYHLSYLVF